MSNAMSLYCGATLQFDMTITQDGTPVNLTGASLRFTAKRNYRDETALIEKVNGQGIEVLDAANGLARVTIEPADTATLPTDCMSTLVYDVRLVTSGQNYIAASGIIRVLPVVTQP